MPCPNTAAAASTAVWPFYLWLGLPLLATLGLMPLYIQGLKRLSPGQVVREDGPQSHLKKQGTPTAGGVLLLALWALAVMATPWLLPSGLWAAPNGNPLPFWNGSLALLLGGTLALGLLGTWDDALKLLKRHNKGVGGYTKLAVQALIGLAVGAYLLWGRQEATLTLPWLGTVDLGWWYLPYAMLVVTGASNAVNLTDGLDGLAGGALVVSWLTLVLLIGLGLPALSASLGAMALGHHVSVLLAGALWLPLLLGFLVFNHNPAKVFMGDAGSLALGGALGIASLLTHQDIAFLGFGALYIWEALSVIIQVVVFKRTGKRPFKMAPFHHHLELCGWSERRVVRTLVGSQLLLALLTWLGACYLR
jgi:phospho-N-acetylmuramoyl-pentapeptide-transferase